MSVNPEAGRAKRKININYIMSIGTIAIAALLIVILSLPSLNVRRLAASTYISENGELNIPEEMIKTFNQYSNTKMQLTGDMSDFIEKFQLLVYESNLWNKNEELVEEVYQAFNDSVSYTYLDERDEAAQNMEKMMAAQAHATVLQENGGEWYSPYQRSRAENVLEIILSNIGEDPKRFKITLLNRNNYNAFSTADGRIYITRGLLTSATDDELAFVIAHEIHHIITGNWMNWWMETNAFQWSGLDNKYYAGVRDLIAAGVTTLTPNSVLSYDQEFEADAYAIYVAIKAGYDPEAMLHAIDHLPDMPVTSHPDAESRIENIENLIANMQEPSWINIFDPCSVAVLEFANLLIPKFEQDWGFNRDLGMHGQIKLERSSSQVNWNAVGEYYYDLGYIRTGISGIQKSFYLVFNNLMNMAKSGGYGVDRLSNAEVEIPERLIGRSRMITPILCVVDIGLDTSMGRSTAGIIGKLLGHVWMLKTDDSGWIIIGAAASLKDLSPELNNIVDELEAVPYNLDAQRKEILSFLQDWRVAFLNDFLDHIEKYIDIPAEELEYLEALNWDIDEQLLIEGKFQALVWSWFTINSNRTSMPIWDLQLQLLSRNVAACQFSFLLQSGLIPYYSANVQMIMVRTDEFWKIAEIVIQ